MSDDLLFRPVHELAGMVRSGELSARELVQTSLDRIAALDGDVHAFVDVFDEDALQEADGIGKDDPRPFAGVPIAIKNNRPVAGRRLTFAADWIGDFTVGHDHNVVRRLKKAGFVVVGTTTLPEYGILPTTETKRFGATHNPWDLDRTPGGSSGGSAAAVAAGMVPVAHANDGGGSTRIPAACCGLVGLKPQRGRISLAPDAGQAFLVQDGVLTRTVGETAALLDVLAGYEVGDATWAPDPLEDFAVSAAADPGRLKIAVATNSPVEGASISAADVQATKDAAALLASLGHEVEEVEAPWTTPGLDRTFTASFGPAVSTQILLASMLAGREPQEDDMEALSWFVWNVSSSITSTQALAAEMQLHAVARAYNVWADQYDLVLCPALAEAPVPLGTIDPQGPDPEATFARAAQFTPFTPLSNITGNPAISLPLYERPADDDAAGLPLGVQLVGKPAEEGVLLAVSAQLEAANPWLDRRAPLVANA